MTVEIEEGDLLWEPTATTLAAANLTHYLHWLHESNGCTFSTYQELWHWSVTEIEAFWHSLWDYFDIQAGTPPTTVLAQRSMPGAQWFPGTALNYAENLFRHRHSTQPALFYQPETGPLTTVSWPSLYQQTARLAETLRTLGVQPGDRVVGYLPNIPETIIAFLATASIGAIWSSCPPDFGERSVLDRFSQIEPKLLIAADGYQWNGQAFDRTATIAKLQAQLPTLAKTILIPQRPDGAATQLANTILWDDALAASNATELRYTNVPFDHPLWVLYSSGTTGLPKPIVQGHGGILLEHHKAIHLHLDLKPTDRFFWYTSTGWMMWNFLVGGLLNGTPIVLYNGNPAYPDFNRLWQLAEQTGMTYFGTSAAFILACMKADIHPGRDFDLQRLRALGSTGSPLPVSGFQWVYHQVSPTLALESLSGGTDLCTAFIGGTRLQPIYAGELQSPMLGAKIQALGEDGTPVINAVGELVISEPMPSMPLYFWNDPGMARYRESYFELFPGVWRHGDWLKINERNGCVIYGRSDSTINRQGVRMGTSEIYQAVERIPEVSDSLIIDLELLGRDSYMPLFVVLQAGATLTDELKARINAKIRQEISPRHVPNAIFAIAEVPYTLSGKKMEVPVRRILLGHPVEKAANVGAMRNPHTLDYFIQLAQQLNHPAKPDR
ncbi:MAG: acetoacetate--CoA ligase [Caldilineaceae bacterium]|nr:acetoacetate--CoA ligase [Caldilineaceae bacterium]